MVTIPGIGSYSVTVIITAVVITVLGPFLSIASVWTVANILNGFMAFPNMIAIFALNGIVVGESVKLIRKKKKR